MLVILHYVVVLSQDYASYDPGPKNSSTLGSLGLHTFTEGKNV